MDLDAACVVYQLSGSFVVFEPEHALFLRRKRIVSQPIGGSTYPAHGPYNLSPYAVYIVATNNLARFKKLVPRDDTSLEQNIAAMKAKLAEAIDIESRLFTNQRLEELKKRDIPVTSQTMKQFDESKLRLRIMSTPDEICSSHCGWFLSTNDVVSMLSEINCDVYRLSVFNDIYRKGFYVSSGMKFGCDFLIYSGDPVRYHAQFAVKVVQPTSDGGYVDLSKIDYHTLNGFQRLTHTANKIPLFATATIAASGGINDLSSASIKYWTLKEREYLTPHSKNTDFESIIPHPRDTNKLRKTS